MANFLYRVGRWAYVNRFKTIAIWVLVLIGLGLGAAFLSKPTTESFSIPGIPSERAQNLMVERFPDKPKFGNDVSVTYVVAAPDGASLTDPRYAAAVAKMVTQLRQVDGVKNPQTAVVNPLQLYGTQQQPGPARQELVAAQEKMFGASPDQAAATVQAGSPVNADASAVQFGAGFDVDASADVTDAMRDQMDAVAQTGRDAGLTVDMKGTATSSFELGVTSELIGIAVGALILILTFASLVAWGMPILTAIVGVAVGMMGVSIATGFFDLSQETPVLATMIGLAVGIDYALFIVSRYRHEIHRSATRAEAAGRAVGTAGSAVVFAGSTVVIALAALAIVNIPFLTAMGIAAAATVIVAVLVALTLLPAILGLFGGKAFGGRLSFLNAPDVTGDETARVHNGQRYVHQVVKRPRLVTGVIVVGLILLALPMAGLKLALPNDGTSDPSTTQRQAYDLIAEKYGPGYNGPLVLVADGARLPDQAARIRAYDSLVDDIRGTDGVAAAWIDAGDVSKNNADAAIVTVIPATAADSDQTHDLVTTLRDNESGIDQRLDVSYGVTGQTAIELDVSDRLSGSLIPYLLVVVGLAFLILIVVFRSILVPLVAALGFLLSVAATFGVTVALFTDGWLGIVNNPQPLVSFLPIMLVGIVFGLAMDYQVFLVTRMREAYVHGTDAKQAVIVGYRHGARVVAAAAAIMISVFAAFMLQDMAFIKVMGFALAIAVVFDAFIIRMTLMPAVLTLLGDKAWWLPRWLDHILPNVDIEGEALGGTADTTPSADTDRDAVPASR
ncbi:MMPL family transporter [Gordonia sp. VNQ95]|uniref:MMPL family transporter n=1 Tax=Gordonia sp. VNQ95 TaxID=3156619 RepID=UPI0032B4B52E